MLFVAWFFFSSRRRHTRFDCDWSSDVCSSDLGRLHAVGGSGDSATGAHEVYDPATDRWSEAPPMPTARDHLAAVAFQGRLWAMGGREAVLGSQYARVEIYDPATNGWYAGTPVPA